jgi:tetratricopeptide (TPR) repeat protein
MAHERNLCRQIVAELNTTHACIDGATFLLRGWEQVSGGVGRPQGKINPLIDDCDYMILLLGHRWGSEPAHEGPYSSGTEEEFHHCLDLLASDVAAMRDVLVLLKALDPDRVRDPGPQLTKVMEFRDRLEASKQLLFATFDSDDKLRAALEGALSEWAKPLKDRTPVRIDLPERRSVEPPGGSTVEQLLDVARKHASDGLIMQAEAAFAHAISDGNPEALTEYAQFSRRIGQLDRALELNRRLLSDPALLQATDAAATAYRVSSLANIGVIERKRGNLSASIDALREALKTARASKQPLPRELCYALDNYGLTLIRVGRRERALEKFGEAHNLRKEFGTAPSLAQSAINLGRAALTVGQFVDAERHFQEALTPLETEHDDHQWANAKCGVAEAKLRRGETEGVDAVLTEALAANERVTNSDGISIARGLLARLALLRDDLDGAEREARMCEAESRNSGSLAGSGIASWLLAEVALGRGDLERAGELLSDAKSAADRTHDPLLASDVQSTLEKLNSLR